MTQTQHSCRSTLSPDEMHHLDQICDVFERAWRSDESPLIEDYLPRVDVTLRSALLEELIAQEVDLRRAAGEDVLLQTYLDRFPADHDAVRRGFALTYRDSATGCPESTAFALVRLKLYHGKQLAYSTYVAKAMEIGRQRPTEPPPYTHLSGADGERLIIAPLQEPHISRQHLFLEYLGPNLVRITSRTTRGDIGVNATRLHPSESAEVTLPALLVLGEYAIRLEPRRGRGDGKTA